MPDPRSSEVLSETGDQNGISKPRQPEFVLRGASQGSSQRDVSQADSPPPPVVSSSKSADKVALNDRSKAGFRKIVDEFEVQCVKFFAQRDQKIKQQLISLRTKNQELLAENRRLSELTGEVPVGPTSSMKSTKSTVPMSSVKSLKSADFDAAPPQEFVYSLWTSEISSHAPEHRNCSGEDYQDMLERAHAVLKAWAHKCHEKKISVHTVNTRGSPSISSKPGRDSKRSKDSESTAGCIEDADTGHELLPFWLELEKLAQEGAHDRATLKSQVTANFTTFDGGRRGSLPPILMAEDAQQASRKMPNQLGALIINPLSRRHIVWQCLGVILIFFDLVTIPLQVFEPDWDTFFVGSLWVTNVYWSLDVCISFFVAFHKNGELVYGHYEIAKHYISTWFTPDILLVTCDVILLAYEIMDASMEEIGYVKVGRVLRILRFIRLVRLVKLRRFFDFFDSVIRQISSEYLLTAARITKLIIFILICTHLLACAWYGLGVLVKEEATNKRSWLIERFQENDAVGYRYSTSLHWSLTQFTPASMEVVPTNAFERAFNILVVIFALVLFSSFVSSITEAMAYLRHVNAKRNEQFGQVRQFFAEKSVSMTITSRVWGYLEQSARLKKTQMLWKDVIVFKELPDTLAKELRQEVYLPTILVHPFFMSYGKVNGAVLRALCYQAVQETALAPGQDLFGIGDLAAHMYFVTSGVLEYFQPAAGLVEDQRVFVGLVELHGWVSEAAMWVRWFHAGWMGAQTKAAAAILVNLNVESTHRLMQQYSEALRECTKYARLFARSHPADDLSDLPNDVDTATDLADEAFIGEVAQSNSVQRISSMSNESKGPQSGMWGLLGGLLHARGSQRKTDEDRVGHRSSASSNESGRGSQGFFARGSGNTSDSNRRSSGFFAGAQVMARQLSEGGGGLAKKSSSIFSMKRSRESGTNG